MTQKLPNQPSKDATKPEQMEQVHNASPSVLADKYGIFLSAFEKYFGDEKSQYGQPRYDDSFGVSKRWEDGSISLTRERAGKKETVKIDAIDVFHDSYKPTQLFPDLALARKKNGKYELGTYEVSTVNMDILRKEIQRISILLTQFCMTRSKLKDLSESCRIVNTESIGDKGLPVYEIRSNQFAGSTFENLIPSYFWNNENLHLERVVPVLRDAEGKKPDPKESLEYLKKFFEDTLTKELKKGEQQQQKNK